MKENTLSASRQMKWCIRNAMGYMEVGPMGDGASLAPGHQGGTTFGRHQREDHVGHILLILRGGVVSGLIVVGAS
jgi:hypothetical protein